MRKFVFWWLGMTLLWGQVASQPTRYYWRNREVVGRTVGTDLFLTREQVGVLLSQEDFSKLEVGPDGQVRLNGQVAPQGPGISLNWLAEQLGFSRRVGSGTVDWVKLPQAGSLPGLDESSWRKRGEFREAGRRLQEVLRELPLSSRADLQERVNRVGQSVVKATPLRDMPWTFVVVSMDGPNAACTGEGHVFVTDSLLDMGISDDELAGVLGHEIAHGVRRHVFRRSDLLRDIGALLKDYRALQTRIDQGERSLQLREQVDRYTKLRDQLQYKFDHDRFYSHLDEEEADVIGLRYAVSAGFSADGLGVCLLRLEKLRVAQFGTAILQDDMSHPPTARRLEILQKARKNSGL